MQVGGIRRYLTCLAKVIVSLHNEQYYIKKTNERKFYVCTQTRPLDRFRAKFIMESAENPTSAVYIIPFMQISRCFMYPFKFVTTAFAYKLYESESERGFMYSLLLSAVLPKQIGTKQISRENENKAESLINKEINF